MIKSNTFFGSQNFMLHNLQPNKLQRSSLLLQYNGLDFQMTSHKEVRENLLYFHERYPRK